MGARKSTGYAFSADPITVEAERRRIKYNSARITGLAEILDELDMEEVSSRRGGGVVVVVKWEEVEEEEGGEHQHQQFTTIPTSTTTTTTTTTTKPMIDCPCVFAVLPW